MPSHLREADLQEKLKNIKLLALDVDGILTDAKILWVPPNEWTRQFNVHDGYGIKLLQKAGIPVAFISGGDSNSVIQRAKWLNISYQYLGNEAKGSALDKLISESGIAPENIAYMGDELFDIPVLRRVGFSATVPHASPEVIEMVDYITDKKGGEGAAREVIDMIRRAQNIIPDFLA